MFEGFDSPLDNNYEEESEEEVSPPRISQFGQLVTNFDNFGPTEEEYEEALLESNPLPVLGASTASRRHRYNNKDQENQPPARPHQGFQSLRDSKHLRLEQQAMMANSKGGKKKGAVAMQTETRAKKAAKAAKKQQQEQAAATNDDGTGASSATNLAGLTLTPELLQSLVQLAGQNGINLGQKTNQDAPPAKKLKAAIAQTQVQRLSPLQAAMRMPKVEDYVKQIEAYYWSHFFRNLKFIDSTQHLDKTVDKFFTKMGLDKEYPDPNYRASWCLTYKGTVNSAITKKRSYIQSEMKKAVWEWLGSEKKWLEANPLPTDDEIRACAYGQVDVDDLRQLYVFKWWWTALLPRVVGKQQWGPQVHLYTTISKATTIISGKEEKLFTSSTLALAVVLYENNYTKWMKIFEFEKEHGQKLSEANVP